MKDIGIIHMGLLINNATQKIFKSGEEMTNENPIDTRLNNNPPNFTFHELLYST